MELMRELVEDNLTIEDLGRGGYQLLQLKDGFRYGTDTTLLAWFAASFVRGNSKARILELGAGCGACSTLICARKANVNVDAVEIMRDSFEVIKKNIDLNELSGRMSAHNADIRELPAEIKAKQYDIVVANPPFFRREDGTSASEDGGKLRLNARFEENGSLDDFVRVAASRVVPSSGYVVMVMRATRAAELLASFEQNKITPIRLMFVHPFADKNASMVLVAGRRGTKANMMKVLPPLVLSEYRGLSNSSDSGEKKPQPKPTPTEQLRRIYEEEHTDCFI